MRVFMIVMLCVAGIFTLSATADVITFVHECETPVSGTLDGEPFEATFIITASGDTDDRQSDTDIFWIVHTSASIEIDGVGTFDFITPTRTLVNNDVGTVGLTRAQPAGGLFIGPIGEPEFQTWDMLSSIGPISDDDGVVLEWDDGPVQTSGGILFIEEELELNVTFTATVIPTAPTIALLGPAALLVTRYARRRR